MKSLNTVVPNTSTPVFDVHIGSRTSWDNQIETPVLFLSSLTRLFSYSPPLEFDISRIPEEHREGIRHSISDLMNSKYVGDPRYRFINFFDAYTCAEDGNIALANRAIRECQDALNIQLRPLHVADSGYSGRSAMGSYSSAMFHIWITLRLFAPATSNLVATVVSWEPAIKLWIDTIKASRYADFFWCLVHGMYPQIVKNDPCTHNRAELKQRLVIAWLITEFVYIHPVTELSVRYSQLQCRKFVQEYLDTHNISFAKAADNDDVSSFPDVIW